MGDNLQLNAGTAGDKLATATATWSGDTGTHFQVVGLTILAGGEGAWTDPSTTLIVGGAGVVTGGVQRIILASDDPAVTALEIIDDWDENDRAKINLIVGQAGIAAGTGVDGVTVPRVTLATNVALPAGTNAIGKLAANSGVDIGDVDILSVPAPLSTTGGGTEAAALRVTLASDSTGLLTVDTSGTSGLEVVQATAADLKCTEASASAIKTAVELIDNSIFVDNAAFTLASSSVTVTGAIRDDTLGALSAVEGDAVPLRVTSTGALWAHDINSTAILSGTSSIATNTSNTATSTASIDTSTSNTDTNTSATATSTSNIDGKITACDTGAVVISSGSVAISSIIPGVAATNLGKARASALGATDTGVAPLAVRNDDLSDLAGTDGDYTPLQVDDQGALYINAAAAEPKRASGVAATTADIITAVADRKLRILALGLFATSATATNIFLNNVDNDLLFNTGNPLPMATDADGNNVPGFVLPYNPAGWFETDVVNEAVALNLSAAQDIAWTITWIEVL